MDLSILKASPGAIHKRKRLGRGRSSGHGKTCTRGQKGQKARSKVAPWFEGGQMPLTRRIPKRGFTRAFKERNQIVNLEQLNIFEEGEVITPEVLTERGLIKGKGKGKVKVLGRGKLNRPLVIKAHSFSRKAESKIREANGRSEVI